MKAQSDNNIGIAPIELLAEPACAPAAAGARRRLLAALAFGALFVMLVQPGLSQIIQLVHVDVQVVANGYRVSKLTGHAVVNDKDQTIGKIDDFVIGRERGQPLFTVMQVGGFLGLGSRLVAVPYDSLVISQNGNTIELPGASKDQLEKLAQFRYGT
jgi:hypothetical protein